MKRWFQRIWDFLRGPVRLVTPQGLGMLGMLLVATAGTGPVSTTLTILLLAFIHFALMRRWGRPLPPERAWPRWLTGAGIGASGALAVWSLWFIWAVNWGAGATWLSALGQSLAVSLMGIGTSWIAWRQVELLRGTASRLAAQEEELGERELNRARQALQAAQGWVGTEMLAKVLKIPESRADQILEHLYIKGELAMEVQENGEILFRWEETPRMTEEMTDEELERLLREE